jgi:hypothetical protein
MFSLWRRLDRPGHDAAYLRPSGEGWTLSGSAVFLDEAGPAALSYSVEVDGGWITKFGRVSGFVGSRPVEHDIRRHSGKWFLDGTEVEGLESLVDLDLSFTPATNILQLRRTAPQMGSTVNVPAAWFDPGANLLSELPQVYERTGATTYRYLAPTVPYQGLLEVSADGFVASYPNLWKREA